MGATGIGGGIDKTDMEKILQENRDGKGAGEREGKKPLTPQARAFQLITIFVVIAYYAVLLFGRFFVSKDNKLFLSLDVFSGIEDPIRIVRMVSLVILVLSVSKVIRFFIARMTQNSAVTRRTGVAVIELLGKVVKYVGIVVLIFLLLKALGVDTAELVAGLGILSLILGLGVTSLVEDIVAGVFIIAERLFDVGDIVVVDDFRGTVLSIGIRSTQIEDEGGDVLILRNSQIENLVNMTNRLSCATCNIPISPTESFARVEEVINGASFDEMKEKIPEIVNGPFYMGLSEISPRGAMIITFVAACKEDFRYRVQRMLNRELKVLFEENQIMLGADDEDE